MAYILELAVLIVAACSLMIIHEMPRTLVFGFCGHRKKVLEKAWKFWQYIDLIGLVFSVTNYSGFSRSFPLGVQKRKTKKWMGFGVFLSLVLCFFLGIGVLKYVYGGLPGIDAMVPAVDMNYIGCVFWQCFTICSASMFLVNLFPVSSFDMGWIIQGFYPEKYMQLISHDGIYKITLVLFIALDIFHYAGIWLVRFFLQ